jgi:hypothetical protein
MQNCSLLSQDREGHEPFDANDREIGPIFMDELSESVLEGDLDYSAIELWLNVSLRRCRCSASQAHSLEPHRVAM